MLVHFGPSDSIDLDQGWYPFHFPKCSVLSSRTWNFVEFPSGLLAPSIWTYKEPQWPKQAFKQQVVPQTDRNFTPGFNTAVFLALTSPTSHTNCLSSPRTYLLAQYLQRTLILLTSEEMSFTPAYQINVALTIVIYLLSCHFPRIANATQDRLCNIIPL